MMFGSDLFMNKDLIILPGEGAVKTPKNHHRHKPESIEQNLPHSHLKLLNNPFKLQKASPSGEEKTGTDHPLGL
jgi:hypothetical protein